ncbi:hypothetical protein [Marinobacterium weihaiense]|uniref:Uncharacterized protein n=1 Tax=Marinobacterium weihaiense TaxID=2851016 RepID=A0ABS6M8R3_9GAMM|nr:hypothetical protein [Marinobacterium weihaiense]MBV0932284.1 hypothetical protein [Marinobacterium weihaiense]
MMQLTRVTTRFVEQEDRFLVSADSRAGVVNLWLTQRLLKRLLPHLLTWVGQQEGEPTSVSRAESRPEGTVSPAAPAESTQTRQANRQLVAQHRKPVADVGPDQAVLTTLVHSLKFQPRGDVLQLIFELPDDVAVLQLKEEQARIWLGVLHKHWQQAQWPDIWPDWIKQAHRIRPKSPVSLVH